MTKTIYPLDNVNLKDKYSPYKQYENIPLGKRVTVDIPNRYYLNFYCYNLIPGISLLINRSNIMDRSREYDELLDFKNAKDNLIITIVYKGQCQLEVGEDKYVFLRDHDVNLYIKSLYSPSFSYLGEVNLFHIIINKTQLQETAHEHDREYLDIVEEIFKKAEKEPNIVFKPPKDFSKNVQQLQNFKGKNTASQKLFYLLKTLEIILELYESDFEDEKNDMRSYSDAQIRVVRNIKNSLSRNIASYVSLEILSVSYGINLTTLKNCFKDMYGKPLYTWYKEYKFYRARELIKNTDYPISKIAHMIGYKSSSKFAKAFKKEMGVLPSSYRKNKK